MTLGDDIIDRIEQASLVEISRAEFMAPSDSEVGASDASNVAAAIVATIAKRNQFARAELDVPAIEREVAAWFAGDKANASALAAILGKALGPSPREVVAATYSPELQLRVLGLDPSALEEPILDVGCGADAALVRFLRSIGKDARGLDIDAPPDAGVRGSWLAHDYGADRYGTIASHLGFSLHFMHQEMKRSDVAYEYARVYMRILKALKRGGTFAYVPGIPFIESMLDARVHLIVRRKLDTELVTDSVGRAQRETGLVLDSATHVTRR